MKKYLFYISQNYSFEILRPIQKIAQDRGDYCAWFVEGNQVNHTFFSSNEIILHSIIDAVDFKPDAVFIPGNIVPNFISGLKVQVFHGLEYKKKGHFKIRGCFDLYCTHGPITSNHFKKLAQKYGYFKVTETGWPKLDPLFNTTSEVFKAQKNKPLILFAPTFSPALTCTEELLPSITNLVEQKQYFWVVKFHPKMDARLTKPYYELASMFDNIVIYEGSSIASIMQSADIMLSDTSSVIGEFTLLNKPVITFKNALPGRELYNFVEVKDLKMNIEAALSKSSNKDKYIEEAKKQIHPYNDGKSSERVLDAVDDLLDNPTCYLKSKPLNLLRKLKLRKRLNYWGW